MVAEQVDLLGEVEARELTDRIRSTADQLCQLILEAHETKAWKALGYATWAEYVSTELDMSRSRAYQLLHQARVVQVAVAAVSTDVDTTNMATAITEAAARDLAGWEGALKVRLAWWPHHDSEADSTFITRIVSELRDDIAHAPDLLSWMSEQEPSKVRDPATLAILRLIEQAGMAVVGSESEWSRLLAEQIAKVDTPVDFVRWSTLAGMGETNFEDYLASRAFVGAEPHG